MSTKTDEQILVVPTLEFREVGYFEGLNFEVDDYMLMIERCGMLFPRKEAETQPCYKQIIPYVLIFRDGQVFSYERAPSGTEDRLHGKISIGVGGHMNSRLFYHEMKREVEEEVILQEKEGWGGFITSAILNHDADPVGQVHLGVVMTTELQSNMELNPGEIKLRNAQFRSFEELAGLRNRMETWSQICFDQISSFQPT